MPSGPEWLIVLVVVLVIFGGSQLPKLAKNLGKAQQEFKDGLAESHTETRVVETPVAPVVVTVVPDAERPTTTP